MLRSLQLSEVLHGAEQGPRQHRFRPVDAALFRKATPGQSKHPVARAFQRPPLPRTFAGKQLPWQLAQQPEGLAAKLRQPDTEAEDEQGDLVWGQRLHQRDKWLEGAILGQQGQPAAEARKQHPVREEAAGASEAAILSQSRLLQSEAAPPSEAESRKRCDSARHHMCPNRQQESGARARETVQQAATRWLRQSKERELQLEDMADAGGQEILLLAFGRRTNVTDKVTDRQQD